MLAKLLYQLLKKFGPPIEEALRNYIKEKYLDEYYIDLIFVKACLVNEQPVLHWRGAEIGGVESNLYAVRSQVYKNAILRHGVPHPGKKIVLVLFPGLSLFRTLGLEKTIKEIKENWCGQTTLLDGSKIVEYKEFWYDL